MADDDEAMREANALFESIRRDDQRERRATIAAAAMAVALFVLLAAVAGLLLAGCAESEPATRLRFGTPPGGTPTATAGIWARSVCVVPPAWLPRADEPALADAVIEYLDDVRLTWPGWDPEPGSGARFPLMVAFHDLAGQNWWAETTRTAWLYWPRGWSGRPVRTAFAPLLNAIAAIDRRRELGRSGPWSAEELDVANRGPGLQITIRTGSHGVYD